MSTKTKNFSLRIDADLKRDFYSFCRGAGLTASIAINLLVQKCINDKKIPFIIEERSNYSMDMEKEEKERINIRIDLDKREAFSSMCKDIGVPMSMVVKVFIIKCIENNCLPFEVKV